MKSYNLFNNKFFIIVFITIMVFILMGVSSVNGAGINHTGNLLTIMITPFQKASMALIDRTNDFFYYFKDMDKLREENKKLLSQIQKIKEENRKLNVYKNQNVELRKSLKLKDSYEDYEPIGANIIARDLGNWFNIFRIDMGTSDGVFNDLPIRTSEGLVGRIQSADVTSSKVITMIDIGNTISAKLQKNGSYVLIRGDLELKEQGLCLMDYIDPDADVAVGDIIETSGLGGVYPKGIIIGKVKEIRKASNDFSKYAVVEPEVDFKRLAEVVILKPKNDK